MPKLKVQKITITKRSPNETLSSGKESVRKDGKSMSRKVIRLTKNLEQPQIVESAKIVDQAETMRNLSSPGLVLSQTNSSELKSAQSRQKHWDIVRQRDLQTKEAMKQLGKPKQRKVMTLDQVSSH